MGTEPRQEIFLVNSPPYPAAAVVIGIVYPMVFVISMALPFSHKLHVRTKISETACHSVIRVCRMILSMSISVFFNTLGNMLKVNSTVSPW